MIQILRRRGFIYVLWVNFSIVLGLVVIPFTIAEIISRVYLYTVADADTFVRYASVNQFARFNKEADTEALRWTTHRHLGYIPTPGYRSGLNRHNTLGFRGEEFPVRKPEGEYRIVCLGASTTYTSYVEDDHKSYPAVLESKLRQAGYSVRVINGGVVSWASLTTLINFETRVLDIDPDMVIIYFSINDIAVRVVWPPEAYRGDNSGAKGPLITERFMPPIWEHSTFIRGMLVWGGWITPHVSIEKSFGATQPTLHWSELGRQHADKTYPKGIFAEVPLSQMLKVNRPVYFRRNLMGIGSIARENGIAMVIASFAHSTHFENDIWSDEEKLGDAYRESNKILEEVSKQVDSSFFDYASAFPDDPSLYTDGIHVNERGAALKGEMFANHILNEGLIPGIFKTHPAR